MKLLSVIFFFLLSAFTAQHSPLPLNAAGKVSFEGFVEAEEQGRDVLFKNALDYTAAVQKAGSHTARAKVHAAKGLVRKEGGFMVYKKGLFTPQPHGEIRYSLELQVSEEGYTYQFTDFVFHYYEKNRFGRYVPVSGKKKPLEETSFAGMQDLWQEHKLNTRQHIENHIRALAVKMLQEPAGVRIDEHTEQTTN